MGSNESTWSGLSVFSHVIVHAQCIWYNVWCAHTRRDAWDASTSHLICRDWSRGGGNGCLASPPSLLKICVCRPYHHAFLITGTKKACVLWGSKTNAIGRSVKDVTQVKTLCVTHGKNDVFCTSWIELHAFLVRKIPKCMHNMWPYIGE